MHTILAPAIYAQLAAAVMTFEGFRPAAYRCAGGKWTIGYGHTQGVRAGQTITQAQAKIELANDLQEAIDDAARLTNGAALTGHQLAALADFAYNLGAKNLAKSTLLRCILGGAGDTTICHQLMRWIYAGGRRQGGLVRRRRWECKQWRTADTHEDISEQCCRGRG